MELEIDTDWLQNHPLTAADLEQETNQLRTVGIRLQVL
jgi:hypothetical protein